MIYSGFNETSIAIFKYIQSFGPVTKKQITESLSLKLTTLNRMIRPLLDNQLIIDVGIDKSSGGRKPSLYDLNTDDYYLVGVDISRTYMTVLLTNMRSTILESKTFEMTEEMTPDRAVCLIKDNINHWMSLYPLKNIVGVGLGTVGPIDTSKGILLNPKKFHSSYWHDVQIKEMIEKATSLPVRVDNGANTAIYIEHKYGDAKSYSSIAYFNCGVGIRTSIIASDTLLKNSLNNEDTFAHMVIDLNGLDCTCGKKGCVETYATIPAVLNQYKELKTQTESKEVISKPPLTFNQLCELADSGDGFAIKALKNAAKRFAVGLSNYMNLFAPELVILGGPMVTQNSYFYDLCIALARDDYRKTQKKDIQFSNGGTFKSYAMAQGAALMLID